jgi:opacity protein-like surface antigen
MSRRSYQSMHTRSSLHISTALCFPHEVRNLCAKLKIRIVKAITLAEDRWYTDSQWSVRAVRRGGVKRENKQTPLKGHQGQQSSDCGNRLDTLTNGPWLFYGKVGGGWVGTDDFTITNLTTGASITGSNNSNSGWLVGAGVEWAFAPNWSAKVEYSFLGLDDRTFVAPVGFISPAGVLFTGNSLIERNRDIQMVKVGVNYRFNWSGYGF